MTCERRTHETRSVLRCNESTAVANVSFLSLNASGWSIDHTDLLARLSITTCRAGRNRRSWSSLDRFKLLFNSALGPVIKCVRNVPVSIRHAAYTYGACVCVSSIVIYHLIKGTNSPLAPRSASLWDVGGSEVEGEIFEKKFMMSSAVQLRRNL